ncbi:MAG: efflux RND transporter periplasmic adaptor subunit [Bacteroidota bacterium]|nr:efflux RND transporter periplasmic adaptor subunit [Bacteroidota bacterium]MDP4193826.1 efflux RND transporter periplasmic adaptor subunit [Bacteroidota bacterium]
MEIQNTDQSKTKAGSSKSGFSRLFMKKSNIFYAAFGILTFFFTFFTLKGYLFTSPVTVKLTTVTFQSASQTGPIFKASGFVVAQRKATVASKATGKLIYLGYVEGDKVKKDQVIGILEDNDIKAQLAQSKANLKLYLADLKEAENNYKRQQILLKSGATTQVELEASESKYKRTLAAIEVAKASISSAQIALENTMIRAPFDGTILKKNAEVGEIVAPMNAGMNSKNAVVTMADMSSLQIDADVSEVNIQKIKVDLNCEVALDAYPGETYSGYVSKIVPTADRNKATVLVKVGLKNYDEKVLPEMSAKVTFLSDSGYKITENPVLVIPTSSVEKIDGKDAVYFVDDSRAKRMFITTGRQFGNYLEVITGLSNNDKIIDEVNNKIHDGVLVDIK